LDVQKYASSKNPWYERLQLGDYELSFDVQVTTGPRGQAWIGVN